ncbi:MAG TPA: MBL fold metallo-hydrolase [Paracoccus sp.]|nr:MBL fold metallo-hydrolase [Paracoccus sp. (in: a-proteobacteria)]
MVQSKTVEKQSLTPFPAPPAPGEAIEVAPGILWLRFPLPYLLDHVNVYLIEDGDGWAVLDTGISDDLTRDIWEAVFDKVIGGRKLTRVIISHHHPDHVGLAGWMARRFDIPVHMTHTEFLMCKYLGSSHQAIHGTFYADHYTRHGAPQDQVDLVVSRGHSYLERITELPDWFITLDARTPLTLGGRSFQVLTGGGHSPDQAMLYAPDEKLFLATDQVIERISPNVSVHAMEPEADPLGSFIDSLQAIRKVVAADALTLPGHHLPLTDPHRRAGELIAHHEARCAMLADLVGARPLSVAEITPKLFTRKMDPHQFSFAFSETLAHVNYMIRQGRLAWVEQGAIWRAGPA